jgi:hypothetical protein
MWRRSFAEEIERRSSNRLAEVAEVLAHHYGQTHLAFSPMMEILLCYRRGGRAK